MVVYSVKKNGRSKSEQYIMVLCKYVYSIGKQEY